MIYNGPLDIILENHQNLSKLKYWKNSISSMYKEAHQKEATFSDSLFRNGNL